MEKALHKQTWKNRRKNLNLSPPLSLLHLSIFTNTTEILNLSLLYGALWIAFLQSMISLSSTELLLHLINRNYSTESSQGGNLGCCIYLEGSRDYGRKGLPFSFTIIRRMGKLISLHFVRKHTLGQRTCCKL